MSHGRRHNPLFYQRRSRTIVAALIAFLFAGCAAEDAEHDPGDDESVRTWSVDSGESSQADAGAGDQTDGADAASTADDAFESDTRVESDASDAAADADPHPHPDWQAIRCDNGQAVEAAFEGTARNPATRLTVYVRDDCALIGTVATSMAHGNFSLALRGRVDDYGDLTLAGSNRDHQCEAHGALGITDASVSISATFDGADFDRDITVQRIE